MRKGNFFFFIFNYCWLGQASYWFYFLEKMFVHHLFYTLSLVHNWFLFVCLFTHFVLRSSCSNVTLAWKWKQLSVGIRFLFNAINQFNFFFINFCVSLTLYAGFFCLFWPPIFGHVPNCKRYLFFPISMKKLPMQRMIFLRYKCLYFQLSK